MPQRIKRREWCVWTSDGAHAVHAGSSLATIASQVERPGLHILAAVELSVLARPEGGAPIRVVVAKNRGPS